MSIVLINRLAMNYQQIAKTAVHLGLRITTTLGAIFVGWLLATLLLPYVAKAAPFPLTEVSLARIGTICLAAHIGSSLSHYFSFGTYHYSAALQTTATHIPSLVGMIIGSFIATCIYAIITS